MALISLANILHRGHYSNEAAIVVHAALDVSKELNVNHFTLGNIYAVSMAAIFGLIKIYRFGQSILLYEGCTLLLHTLLWKHSKFNIHEKKNKIPFLH